MQSKLTCVVLAGGLATRMRPVTTTVPKALIPVLNQPFVNYQLQWLAHAGISNVIFCIGYLGEQIQDYVQNGSRWGIKVDYVNEGTQLRGTGGALRLAVDQGITGDSFLLTYGDSFLPVDFKAVWNYYLEKPTYPVMVVFRNSGQWDKSNVQYQKGWVQLYDKNYEKAEPSSFDFIDYGLSVVTRASVLELIPQHSLEGEKKVDLSQYFHHLSVEGRLRGFETQSRFYEVGSPSGLADFTEFVKNRAKNDA